MALICDTGPLFAALDSDDPDHKTCADLLTSTTERLIVPAPVLVELEWLTVSRIGWKAFESILDDVAAGAIGVADLTRDDYLRVRDLGRQYADLPLGFVDAAVIAVTERLNETAIATLDARHFHVVRPKHAAHLTLLPG